MNGNRLTFVVAAIEGVGDPAETELFRPGKIAISFKEQFIGKVIHF